MTVCDKQTGKNTTFEMPFDKLMRSKFVISDTEGSYLLSICDPLALKLDLQESDNEWLRSEAEKIDEEGNLVLISVKLKE